jgi:hypothetical protein
MVSVIVAIRRVEKALSLDVDAVILDLEDAGATAEKRRRAMQRSRPWRATRVARRPFGEAAAGWSTIALPEPGRRAGLWPDPWATKPTFRLVCRIEQRSLISLLMQRKNSQGSQHRRGNPRPSDRRPRNNSENCG